MVTIILPNWLLLVIAVGFIISAVLNIISIRLQRKLIELKAKDTKQ